MNTKLLQKAIDELKSDKPDLSYLRGMLETMMDMQSGSNFVSQSVPNTIISNQPVSQETTKTAAEIAASIAESGFIKGTNPGVIQHAPVISNG